MSQLLLPHLTEFDQLFSEWQPWDDYRKECPEPAERTLRTYGWMIPFSPRTKDDGPTWFGPYAYCDFTQAGGEWHVSVALRPTDPVIEALRGRWLAVSYDVSHYKLIGYANDTTLVTISYNNIIGGAWLSRVRTESIPFFTRKEA